MSRDNRHLQSVGPDFEVPNMPGGILLKDPRQQERPLTVHETTFQSCNIEVQAVINEDMEVMAVQFVVTDFHERHRYILNFLDNVRDEIMSKLTEIPRVGEKVPEGEVQG